MEKLKNLIVEADGKTFESSPVIASRVIGIAQGDSLDEENKVSFIIQEGKRKLLVMVDKQNIRPHNVNKTNKLEAGMFVLISGQIADEGIAVIPEFGVLYILEAEQVIFSFVEELDPSFKDIVDN